MADRSSTDQTTGDRRPENREPSKFPPFAVTVDIVILTVIERDLKVLLIERGTGPYRGSWALPGGFKRSDETLDEAAKRELREETRVEVSTLQQFGAYGDPGRDPRTDVVTVAYFAVVPRPEAVRGGTDAKTAELWSLRKVMNDPSMLAFDHAEILRDALARAEVDLGVTELATAFVGPEFTLSELQSVYEAVWNEELDAANFRRSLLPKRHQALPDSEPTLALYLERTGRLSRSNRRGGRPPELFRACDAWQDGSPVRRSRRRFERDR